MRRPAAPPERSYVDFINAESNALLKRRGEPPATEEGWRKRLEGVRRGLERSFGRMPKEPCDLAPEVLGTIQRDGYAIERLTFQSRPGVRVTANLYRPDPAPSRVPAVLSVHGHWSWARMDPVVQARNIGLAKLGYIALCVDAFGSGERAIEPAPGTYHGGLVGASLWPAGVPLVGLQVYDNRRAVDYLLTRPEVDPKKLAVTGASGGGNQTLYAGATDDRFTAVVPVCGIGTYEAYLGTGCCICEMNAAGLTYADTGDLLAMIAPRALLVINATKDAVQFSVAEAAISIAHARTRYMALNVGKKLKHLPVESGHDYNRTMREAMYGWVDLWLRDKGDGSPVKEPEHQTEDPQALRCYPDSRSRPKTIVTIPEFALREGRERLKALPRAPDHRQAWEAEAAHLRAALVERVDVLPASPPEIVALVERITISARSGVRMAGHAVDPTGNLREINDFGRPRKQRVATTLLLRHEGIAPDDDPLVTALRASGRAVVSVDLRATGRGKPDTPPIAGVADHNEAEWGVWIGRPLLWQWVEDVLTWTDGLSPVLQSGPRSKSNGRPDRANFLDVFGIEIIGMGPFGLVGAIAAAIRPQSVVRVGWIDPLVSFVAADATPWAKLPMGLIAPDILDLADVGHLLALIAPKPLVLAGGVEPSGARATAERRAEAFGFARAIYRLLGAAEKLAVLDDSDPAAFARAWAAG